MASDIPKTVRGLQTYLQNIRAPEARTWLAIGGGLTVCLEPSGAKTFQARIRRQGEPHARRVRIGSFPALSVASAREKLLELKAHSKEGRDPAVEHRRARAGITVARTLSDLIAAYLASREGHVAPKTVKIERDLLEGVLDNALGDRLLSDLGPVDFGAAISKYAARLKKESRSAGTNANKLLAASRRMFRWARGSGLITIADPTADLTRPAKEQPRDRILVDGRVLVGPEVKLNEIGALLMALDADPSPIAASRPTRIALHLTLLFGFRALEVSSLEWRSIELDGDAPSVSVTKSKTKAGLRTLPMPATAVALLRELRASADKRAKFLFPAEEGAKRTAGHLHPESLSRAFARSCARLKFDHATLHDLRRTCLSGLNELGHEGISRRIAGHAAVDVMGRHYDRSARIAAMRRALEDWAEAVTNARARVTEARAHGQ